ncbi:hypothetical protein Raf01_74550 [Rugosimonospora africana]|uniref:Uncharacterized protein n=1 Tax=Rugosimonospora africana TaxID=556532 RepID=A0A8J3R0F6_9ACTN|nr:hypothetical protein Raf01_74550 [Rugosimonospora africana]
MANLWPSEPRARLRPARRRFARIPVLYPGEPTTPPVAAWARRSRSAGFANRLLHVRGPEHVFEQLGEPVALLLAEAARGRG